MSKEIELIMSPLRQKIERDGQVFEVEIYADGEGKWILEVVDESNTSTVWNEHFATDQAALDELKATIEKEGVSNIFG